jgi:NAD(P)H-dependent FMN reductase
MSRGEHTKRIVLISGSLRSASTNTAVLRTAITVTPEGVGCRLDDRLVRLPMFNPDTDRHPLDMEVTRLRETIHGADAILFSTPEYAGALPGSLKNLLDWTIGDDQAGSIDDKPVAWVNASPRGATAAYYELRTVLGYAHAHIIETACIHIPITPTMVGPDGLIADSEVRSALAHVLVELVVATTEDH